MSGVDETLIIYFITSLRKYCANIPNVDPSFRGLAQPNENVTREDVVFSE